MQKIFLPSCCRRDSSGARSRPLSIDSSVGILTSELAISGADTADLRVANVAEGAGGGYRGGDVIEIKQRH